MRRVVLLLVLTLALGGCDLAVNSPPVSSGPASSPSPAGAAAVPVTPTPTIGPVTHVVQPGETLWDISLHYGIGMQDIMTANNISDPNRIEAGQELLIPLGPLPGPVDVATAQAYAAFTPIVDPPFKFKAWVNDLSPFVTGKEIVNAQLTTYDVGIRGAQMYAVVHFAAGEERLTAQKTSDGSGKAFVEFPVKKAARGETVLVDVYMDAPDRSFRTQTAFTAR